MHWGSVKVADRSGLEAAVEQAGALANEGWTADTWERAARARIAAGKALLEDGAATQEQIDQAEKGIRDAMAALKKADADGGGSAGGDHQSFPAGDQGQSGAGKTDAGAQKNAVVPAGSGSATAGKAGASASSAADRRCCRRGCRHGRRGGYRGRGYGLGRASEAPCAEGPPLKAGYGAFPFLLMLVKLGPSADAQGGPVAYRRETGFVAGVRVFRYMVIPRAWRGRAYKMMPVWYRSQLA